MESDEKEYFGGFAAVSFGAVATVNLAAGLSEKGAPNISTGPMELTCYTIDWARNPSLRESDQEGFLPTQRLVSGRGYLDSNRWTSNDKDERNTGEGICSN